MHLVSRTEFLTRAYLPALRPYRKRAGHRTGDPSMRFRTLRRHQLRTATHTELTGLRCATPTGFLSLLTSCSVRNLAALFRAADTHGLLPSEVFPARQPSRLATCAILHAIFPLLAPSQPRPTLRSQQPWLRGFRATGRSVPPTYSVNRTTEADPLLTFPSPRYTTLGTRSSASTGPPLMGLVRRAGASPLTSYRLCRVSKNRGRGHLRGDFRPP